MTEYDTIVFHQIIFTQTNGRGPQYGPLYVDALSFEWHSQMFASSQKEDNTIKTKTIPILLPLHRFISTIFINLFIQSSKRTINFRNNWILFIAFW